MSTHAQESFDCLIEPNVLVELSSSEFGVLSAVSVNEADVVAVGDVLATLQDDVEKASLTLTRARAAAVSEVDLLRHDHEFNQRKRRRIDQLQDQQAISPQTADEVRTAEELAKLRLRAANEKQRTIRLEAKRDALSLERRTIRSPVDGVVARRYKSAGEYVEGDPILQLAQLDPLRVVVVVPITMYGEIEVGMRGIIQPELPIDGDFVATVESIDPVMDAATATFAVRLSLPNPEHRLPPGLRCSVALQDAESLHKTGDKLANEKTEPHRGPPLLQSEPVVHSPAVPAAAMEVCSKVGPISLQATADQLAERFTQAGLVSERRSEKRQSGAPRWIVLSGPSGESAAVVAANAREAGIDDFQRLARGPWQGRVAFGAYHRIRSAERRRDELIARGFDAVLAERDVGAQKFWFDVRRSADAPEIAEIIDAAGLDVRIEEVSCPRLASR